MLARFLHLLLLPALLSGCAGSRVMRLENKVLKHEIERLEAQVVKLEERVPASAIYVADPTLADVAGFLRKAGYKPDWEPGQSHVRLNFEGLHTDFSVNIQLFEEADVLFLATNNYLALSDAEDTDAIMLLLVQLATLNYQLLLGKFQLDPESGNIILSSELILKDGLGYDTFMRAFEQLLQTADLRYPDLKRAAAGSGL